ncbi:hypothetical protein [Marinivivus vitaminiproducens]|uniref:hypothetical protein n=1 Tax=Marinivivus vitaminiproducens TaxID=3035935 RepID=UPI0027A6D276|nr:hypothetical protein P4R82_13465 [Geminicoccaceae bacterium SCSIO 64248]
MDGMEPPDHSRGFAAVMIWIAVLAVLTLGLFGLAARNLHAALHHHDRADTVAAAPRAT